MQQQLTAILPSTDLDAAQAFFQRPGFTLEGGPADYRMLVDGMGGHVHLAPTVEGWLMPGRHLIDLYLYREDVNAVAAVLAGEVIEPEGASDKLLVESGPSDLEQPQGFMLVRSFGGVGGSNACQ